MKAGLQTTLTPSPIFSAQNDPNTLACATADFFFNTMVYASLMTYSEQSDAGNLARVSAADTR